MKTLLSINITDSYLATSLRSAGSLPVRGPVARDRGQTPFDRRGGHLPRRKDLQQTIHSLRKAVIGSMRPAPRAGM
jgi:hypothetical protein